MKLYTQLYENFDDMVESITKTPSPETLLMLRQAYAGGALVTAKTIGTRANMLEVAAYAKDSNLISRMPG